MAARAEYTAEPGNSSSTRRRPGSASRSASRNNATSEDRAGAKLIPAKWQRGPRRPQILVAASESCTLTSHTREGTRPRDCANHEAARVTTLLGMGISRTQQQSQGKVFRTETGTHAQRPTSRRPYNRTQALPIPTHGGIPTRSSSPTRPSGLRRGTSAGAQAHLVLLHRLVQPRTCPMAAAVEMRWVWCR